MRLDKDFKINVVNPKQRVPQRVRFSYVVRFALKTPRDSVAPSFRRTLTLIMPAARHGRRPVGFVQTRKRTFFKKSQP